MDSDIKGTIARLDARIAKLRKIKEMLLEEFAISESKANGRTTGQRLVGLEKEVGMTRKDTVAKYIAGNGPQLRKDLRRELDIPVGTIAYVLNDKSMFKSRDDGRWDITESVRKELES